MDITIAICTVTERVQRFLPRIVEDLRLQARLYPNVEILYLGDNRKRKTGTKRNNLIDLAQGRYIAFVDDDDKVSDKYVSYMSAAAQQEADCICFKAKYYENDKYKSIVDYSINYNDETKDGIYLRQPNHITAIRTDLARKIRFKDINIGEDFDYANRLKKHLR